MHDKFTFAFQRYTHYLFFRNMDYYTIKEKIRGYVYIPQDIQDSHYGASTPILLQDSVVNEVSCKFAVQYLQIRPHQQRFKKRALVFVAKKLWRSLQMKLWSQDSYDNVDRLCYIVCQNIIFDI